MSHPPQPEFPRTATDCADARSVQGAGDGSSSDWEWCRLFIDDHCIYRSPPGAALLTSAENGTNAWQFYLPIAILDQEFMHRCAGLFWNYYRGDYYRQRFQVCGCESGGSVLMSALQAVSDGADLRGFMIKKAAKSYGLQNWLEGVVEPDLPILLIDDVVGSGKTLRAQWHRLEGFGLKLIGCFAIAACKKPMDLGEKHKLSTLFRAADFARSHSEYTRKYQREPTFYGTVT